MSGPVLFVSWSVQHGRSRDLAAALGAEAVFIGIRSRRRRWLSPARYVTSSLVTVKLFLTRRPSAIIVMQPPLPLAVVALVYGRLRRVPVALDAHTGAALAMRTGRQRRSLRILGRFAAVTIVTNAQLADPLTAGGVHAVILHDPVPEVESDEQSPPAEGPFTVVAPLSWAADEPVDMIIAAAARCPEISFVATGRPPAGVAERADLPGNLRLVGFLSDEAFESLMRDAGVVLALTTRDATMQRAGYEALAFGRPVIASDTQVLREFFGDAALYAATAMQLADAVNESRERATELAAAMRARRVGVRENFDQGIAEVSAALRLPRRG